MEVSGHPYAPAVLPAGKEPPVSIDTGYIVGMSFKKLRLFLHKVCVINTFSPLCETLYVGRVKVFAEASELYTHAVCGRRP
jgi:hypothetical protein